MSACLLSVVVLIIANNPSMLSAVMLIIANKSFRLNVIMLSFYKCLFVSASVSIESVKMLSVDYTDSYK